MLKPRRQELNEPPISTHPPPKKKLKTPAKQRGFKANIEIYL